jgi:hypothetical protein
MLFLHVTITMPHPWIYLSTRETHERCSQQTEDSVEVASAVQLDGGVGELHCAGDVRVDVLQLVNDFAATGGAGGDGKLVALQGVAISKACGEGKSLTGVTGCLAVDGDVAGEGERGGWGAHCSREDCVSNVKNGMLGSPSRIHLSSDYTRSDHRPAAADPIRQRAHLRVKRFAVMLPCIPVSAVRAKQETEWA